MPAVCDQAERQACMLHACLLRPSLSAKDTHTTCVQDKHHLQCIFKVREYKGMHSMQVHAISSKASDVRSVVMDLNAKRQAADEDVISLEPLLPLPANGKHVKEELVSAIKWQDYDEVCIPPYRHILQHDRG